MIQWLGTPVQARTRGALGQVPDTIILSVQRALNRESDLRGSLRDVFESGIIEVDTCALLREWGGNALDPELRVLVNSWGSQLQAECAEAGFGPPVATGYPWRRESSATRALQSAINAALAARGNCTLGAPDGELGPQTCEAGQYLENQGVSVAGWSQARPSCQQFASAWDPTRPCPTGAPQPQPPTPAPPATRASSGIGVGGVAFLAAVLVGGIYLATQVT